MAHASMWGQGPLSEEREIKARMMLNTWWYCLILLGFALLSVWFVSSLQTPFWSDLAERGAARLNLWF
jgi:hypothetical protein